MADVPLPTRDRVEGYFKELNNWGRWGHDDQLGTVNLITPAKQAQAQRLIKKGRTVSLARDVVPRPVYMYHMTFPSKRERVDVVLDRFDMVYHGFWITHVDALCHVGWDGELYNGRPFAESLTVEGALWCPIDPIFTRGITTRGVFLDVAAARKEGYVTVGRPVTPRELDEAERRAGVKVEPGDVVVLRSGDEKFRLENPDWKPRISEHPGLHVSCLEWFREKDIAAISWDMMDERPSGYPGFGMSTHLAIPFLGLALIDNSDPERLAKACAEEGRNEFLFTATPLRLVGATGAPARDLLMNRRAPGRSVLPLALVALLFAAIVFARPAAHAFPADGEMRWGLHVTLAPKWLDPAETEAFSTPFMVLYAVHDALVKPMPGGLNTPSLAESWQESKDHLSFTFTLRKNARFHNGEPVTAEDVKFSFERYKGASATLLKEKVKEVQVLGPGQVRSPGGDARRPSTVQRGDSFALAGVIGSAA